MEIKLKFEPTLKMGNQFEWNWILGVSVNVGAVKSVFS